MIASLDRMRKHLTLKVLEQAGGQDVMVLINPRVYHSFIYEGFAERKGLKIKGFEGFRVFPTPMGN